MLAFNVYTIFEIIDIESNIFQVLKKMNCTSSNIVHLFSLHIISVNSSWENNFSQNNLESVVLVRHTIKIYLGDIFGVFISSL